MRKYIIFSLSLVLSQILTTLFFHLIYKPTAYEHKTAHEQIESFTDQKEKMGATNDKN